ncbi:MAG: Crp/Fnr family transcriptional regulator [Clostridia bacterium]|nr:Crp/Fnr family transcriptional regulator [Clostridia bacterium]
MSGHKPGPESVSLFDGIPEDRVLSELERMGADVVDYEKNSCIIREGEKSDRFGVVMSGSVRVEHTDAAGNRNIAFHVLSGNLFGAAEVLSHSELRWGIYANEDCRVILFRRDVLSEPCGKSEYHHRFILNVLGCVAQSGMLLGEKIDVLSKRTTRERLMTFLRHEEQRHGKREFDILFDRQGLADYLCVDRSALSAEIGRMRADGLIEARRSHCKLL